MSRDYPASHRRRKISYSSMPVFDPQHADRHS